MTNQKTLALLLATAAMLAACPKAANADEWTGNGTTLNWSDTGNWDTATTPTASTTVYLSDAFYSLAYTNAAGTVNNVLDANYSVGTWIINAFAITNTFAPFQPNHYYTTLIPAGNSLTLAGNAAPATPALQVGMNVTSYPAGTVVMTITGGGNLLAPNQTSTLTISEGANASGTHKATLDLSGLNTFTATVSNLWLGVSSSYDKASGAILMAKTNSVTTSPNASAPGILLGRGMTNTAFGSMTLGTLNTINTDGLVVGGARASLGQNLLTFGTPTFGIPSAATLTLRGSAGGSSRTAVFSMGDSSATETNYAAIANGTGSGGGSSTPSTADFSGGTVDILADRIFVGRSAADTLGLSSGTSAGTALGSLTFANGTIDANAVALAFKQGTNRSLAVGTITAKGNAVLNVAGDLTMSYVTNATGITASSMVATLNVNDNAVVKVGGNLTNSGGTATISLLGGTINMTNGGLVSVNTLQGFGTITNASTVTVSNAIAPGFASASAPTAHVPGTLRIGTNLVMRGSTATKFKLGSSTTPGGGINDYIDIAGNLTSSNPNIDLGFVGTPAIGGSYDLIRYGGVKSGSPYALTFVNTTRGMTFSLSEATPGHVYLNVGGTAGATLTWKGGTSVEAFGNWDLTNTIAWNNNTEKFYTFDNVVFDDTATKTIINVSAAISPGNITFNNNSKQLTFSAASKISGPAGVTKNGTGTVIWGGSGTHEFTGNLNINQGTIQVQSTGGSGLFGTTNKMITIANGATLDLYGNSVGTAGTGWPITFSGTGVGGVGAIAHTKTSSGPTLSSPRLTLAGDATISATTAGLGLTVSGVTTLPAGGDLNLAGYTLTTAGAGNVNFLNLVMTNAGSIIANSANLQLRDVILDGPGTLSVGSKTLVLGNLTPTAWATGYLAKAMSVAGGTIMAPGASILMIPVTSPITLAGGATISNAQPVRLAGVISGGYGVAKLGPGTLSIGAANLFSGATVVSNGTLVLEASGSLASSPLLRMNPGTTLDLSPKGISFALAPGQTLQLDGSAIGNISVPALATLAGSGTAGNDVSLAGGAIVPGLTNVPRTFTVAKNLTLGGGNALFELDANTTEGGNVNDLIQVNGNLTLSGSTTIKIVPIGTLDTSTPYTLITYAGARTGSTNNLVLQSDTRYAFTFVDPDTTPGKIQVMVSGGSEGLEWRGGVAGNPTGWNINTTSNWDNGGNPGYFFNGDTVRFDDDGLTGTVTMETQVRPAAITMANDSVAYTFGGSGGLRAGALTNNGTAGLTIANSGDNTLLGGGLFLNNSAVTFNQPVNATLNSLLNGSQALNKNGANRLALVGNNGSTFFGPVNVNAGTLKAESTNAFGAGTVSVASPATVDLNGQILDAPTLNVSGGGVGGIGAIINSGSAQANAISKLTLTGNTTLNSSNRWDVMPGSVQGQDYTLTKIGGGDLWFDVGSDTGFGDIDIKQGRLVFAWPGTDLGNTANTITVRSNASLAFSIGATAGAKPTAVEAGGEIATIAGTTTVNNTYAGNVSFGSTGVVRVAVLSTLNLSGSVTGPNGLVLTGPGNDQGTLTLSGSNAYSGDFKITRGSGFVSGSNALPANTSVTMDGDLENQGVFFSLANGTITDPTVPLNMLCYRTPSGPRTPSFSGEGTWSGSINMIGVQLDPSQIPQVTFSGATNLTINGPVIQSGNSQLAMNINGFPGTVRFTGPLQFYGTMRMGSQGLGIDPWLTQWFTTLRLDSSNNNFTNMLFWRGKIIVGADNAIPTNCPITTSLIVTDNDHRGIIDLQGHVQTFVNFPGLAPIGGFPAMPIWIGNDSDNADATVVFKSTLTNQWACWLVDKLDQSITTPRKTGLTVQSGYLRLARWSWGNWYDPSGIIAPTNNAYSGPTLVTGGGLQVDNAISNTPVTISGTGTLAGSGPIYGPAGVTIASGGTLSPGGSATFTSAIGIMTNYSTLVLQAGSKCLFDVNLGTKTNDSVYGMSSVTYGGTMIINNVGTQVFTNGASFKLFTAASYTAGPVTIQPASPGTGLMWDATDLAVNGTLKVVTAVAPIVSDTTHLPDGNIAFTITGITGQGYSVRASTNVAIPLVSWTLLSSGNLPSPVSIFTDLTATNYPVRFYRTSTP